MPLFFPLVKERATLMVSIRLNMKQFESDLKRELARELGRKAAKALPKIEKRVKAAVGAAIKLSPTYTELTTGGPLVGALGIENSYGKIVDLVQFWIESIKVTIKKSPRVTTRGISFALSIQGCDTTEFTESLGLPLASYVAEGGSTINWLKWLLLEGDRAVIIGYRYSGNNSYEQRFSRTNQGIMRRKAGDRFSVPPEHAGTQGNNFLSKALRPIEADIEKILSEELKG